ncbi:MAG: NAD(P)/FAD-dependent oxidoreductase [Comamonas sp.]
MTSSPPSPIQTAVPPATTPDTASAPPPAGLPALEARLRQDLQWLTLPGKSWVPAREHDGDPLLPVAVIGGGMAGLALSAALKLQGVPVLAFDQSAEGFEGPWATTARMETLRSPKELPGPALGLPALTFRAWFESQFGRARWDALDKIPRLQWMDYLRWYRRVLGLEVRNRQRVQDVRPHADHVELQLSDLTDLPNRSGPNAGGRPYTVRARHLVIASGHDGLGGPALPEWARRLPAGRWAHSSHAYDVAALRGQRVVVIGGASSAMDSAASALEAGAARVDLLIRAHDLPRVNKSKGAGSPGMLHGYWQLPDEWKWRLRQYINAQQIPPPHGSTLRVSRHANAHFQFGAAVHEVAQAADGSLRLHTGRGVLAADFVIFCTGFRIDWPQRPEYARIAPHVRRWGDRYTPPPGLEDAGLADSPDLGPAFEFLPREPGACPGLERIHAFCFPAALSQGAGAGDIPQISAGAQRLAQALSSTLLGEDIASHYAALERYAEPELLGDEWQPAEWPADAARGTDDAPAPDGGRP